MNTLCALMMNHEKWIVFYWLLSWWKPSLIPFCLYWSIISESVVVVWRRMWMVRILIWKQWFWQHCHQTQTLRVNHDNEKKKRWIDILYFMSCLYIYLTFRYSKEESQAEETIRMWLALTHAIISVIMLSSIKMYKIFSTWSEITKNKNHKNHSPSLRSATFVIVICCLS